MKLQHKIGLVNVALGIFFLVLAIITIYFVTNRLIYQEMDKHLLSHKQDLVNHLNEVPEAEWLKALSQFRVDGTVEWLEFRKVNGVNYSTEHEVFQTVNYTIPGDTVTSSYRRYQSLLGDGREPVLLELYEKIEGWDSISYTITSSMIFLISAWMVLVYIGNSLAFKKLLSPLYKTVEKLPTIQDPEKTDISFPESTTYEINQLHAGLNRMLAQLQSLFKQQKEFMQNASHELLTPMTIIRQKTDKLLEIPDLDETSYKTLIQMQETVSRVSRLSKTLLLISKIESNQYKMEEQFMIRERLEVVLNDLEDFIIGKKLEMKVSIEPDSLISGNRDLIYILLFNIIHNAVKYSPENAAIEIEGKLEDERYTLIIRDYGKGIPAEKLTQIFKRFKKVHGSWNESPGLGLSIVKSICELHQIEYKIDSEVNKGTQFKLRFRL